MKCENCNHLGERVILYNDDFEQTELGTSFYVCNKMRLTIDSGIASKESIVDNAPELACVTGSGSGYQKLIVEKGFFCAHYNR